MIDLEKVIFVRRNVKLGSKLYSTDFMEKETIQSRSSYPPFKWTSVLS